MISLNVARLTASRAVFVSRFLEEKMSLGAAVRPVVVPNGLSDAFFENAARSLDARPRAPRRPPNCLMLCSLKAYKGVNEFVELARAMPGRWPSCRCRRKCSKPSAP